MSLRASPWATFAATIVGVGVLFVLLVGYVRHVDQRSDARSVQRERQICGLIVIIDDRSQAMPPTTDEGLAAYRRELHAYRLGLGC